MEDGTIILVEGDLESYLNGNFILYDIVYMDHIIKRKDMNYE